MKPRSLGKGDKVTALTGLARDASPRPDESRFRRASDINARTAGTGHTGAGGQSEAPIWEHNRLIRRSCGAWV